jgi:hypothetical protein
LFNPSNKQIRTLLQLEKGSDFVALVEQNPSVNTGEIYPTNNVPVLAPDGGIRSCAGAFRGLTVRV